MLKRYQICTFKITLTFDKKIKNINNMTLYFICSIHDRLLYHDSIRITIGLLEKQINT